MSKFWMTTEDPTYDEDGVLVDEDADWEDAVDPGDLVYNEDLGEWVEIYSPFDTVNS